MKSTESMQNTLNRLSGESLDLEMANPPANVSTQFLKAKLALSTAAYEFGVLNILKDKHSELIGDR